MYLTAFSSSSFGKWILPGIGCIWFLGGYFLLLQQGISEEQVLVDAFFFTLLFLGGVLLLDRVFRHYTPNRKNGFLLVLFPLLLSGGLVWSHAQLLDWWYAEESDYLDDATFDEFIINTDTESFTTMGSATNTLTFFNNDSITDGGVITLPPLKTTKNIKD